MNQVNPYLTFNGTCEAAFNFYKSVFGGKFNFIGRFKIGGRNFALLDFVTLIELPVAHEATRSVHFLSGNALTCNDPFRAGDKLVSN